MSDFELFNKALQEYNKTEKSKKSDPEKSDSDDSKNNECHIR